MITFSQRGDYSKLTKYFERIKNVVKMGTLDKYGAAGVEALRSATPVDSGDTANAWFYKVVHSGKSSKIEFHNSNVEGGTAPIAILLQYGHGNRGGGFIEGKDYINPAIKPIFDKIVKDAWREVTRT